MSAETAIMFVVAFLVSFVVVFVVTTRALRYREHRQWDRRYRDMLNMDVRKGRGHR